MAAKKMPPRTERDEKNLQSALKKAAQRGKAKEADKSVGAQLRKAFKENA